MAAKIDLTFDCADAKLLAEFWKTALEYVDEPPPAPYKTREEWLAQFDLPEGDSADDGAWLCDPDIRVPGRGSPDERWARIRAESARLVEAGGSVVAVLDRHIVMADPEGNEFCVAAMSA